MIVMTYFETLMQQVAMLCLTTTISGVGEFVSNIDKTKLAQTQYVHLLSQIAERTAGCSNFDSTDSLAFASNITAQLLQIYDSKNADQTFDVMALITLYMQLKPNNFPVDMEKEKIQSELTKIAELWLEVWLKTEAEIDPNWTTSEVMQPFNPSKPILFNSGMSPEAISDPKVRIEYEQWLEKEKAFLSRQRSQTIFRQALNDLRIDYVDYLSDLKNHLGDTTDSIINKINTISDTKLKSKLTEVYS